MRQLLFAFTFLCALSHSQATHACCDKKEQKSTRGAVRADVHRVVIIGGGVAGLSAAIYAGRADFHPVVFAGDLEHKGGLLIKTSVVENYPGFPEGIQGFDLVSGMEKQAKKYGTEFIDKDVTHVDFSQRPFLIVDSDKKTYKADALILAPGSTPNKLKLPNEDQLWGNGISSCAVCDGVLYRKKRIVVVGGGDSALEEALFLTKFSDVTLIHRRDSFAASKAMQNKLLDNPKIKVVYDTIITSLNGISHLESVTIQDVKTKKESRLGVDGLFYGLGLSPNSQLFTGQLETDGAGYILKKPHDGYETSTSIEGVFVAGDVSDHVYRQAIVAAGDGAKAALDVDHYLNH